MDGAIRTRLKILHVICSLLLLGSGDFQVWGLTVTGKDGPIEALRGEDVTIPCLVSGVPIPLKLQKVSVVWRQILLNGTEHEVYRFRSSHHESLRNGSHMNDSDIEKGNASLSIPNIQITDEGDYVCFVIVTPDAGIGTSTLHVSVKPQATLSHMQTLESTDLITHVYCKVSKFYPEAVDIRWDKYSKMNGTNSTLDEDVSLTIPLRNSDRTFNVTSVLILRPSTGAEPGDVIFCIVNHRSLKEEITLSFIIGRRNPIIYLFYVTIIFMILQIFSASMKIAFKKRWRPWAHAFAIATMIAIVICMHFDLYFMEGINGMPQNAMHIIFPAIVAVYSILMAIYGILFLKYFIKGKLTVSEISGDECLHHMKRTTLTWQITNFRQKEIHINVYLIRRNEEKHLIASWESTGRKSSNNSPNDLSMTGGQEDNNANILPLLEVEMTNPCIRMYKCLCSISITLSADTDDMALLAVEVGHASLERPIYISIPLIVYKDKPVVSDIGEDWWIPHMDKQTLPFQITDFKLKEIHINVYLKRRNEIKNHLIHSWASVDPPPAEDNAAAELQNGDVIEEDPLLEDAVNDATLPSEMEVEMTETEDGSYKCDCRISLTPNIDRDDGAVLTVEVIHASLPWPVYQYQILKVFKGDKPSFWRSCCLPVCDAITIYDVV